MANLDEHFEELSKLFLQLVSEIEKRLGHKVYLRLLQNGREWGLYATEDYKENFSFVSTKVRSDRLFPNCPLPHLRIGLKKYLADRAGVTPDAVKPQWHFGDDEAYWCVPQDDDEKLKKVALYLAKIYHQRQG